MPKLNVLTTDVKKAIEYVGTKFSIQKKNIYHELPNFEANYEFLQSRMEFALDIPRSAMPVIEPKDMNLFKQKIKSGHIDIFQPHASTALFPHEFTTKRGSQWLTLGLKDGSIIDDVLKAELIFVPAKDLKPIQKQIWLDVMTEGMLKYGVPKKPLTTPIIISSEYFIIDGHHRWGQVMLSNPNLGIQCLHVPLDILTLINMARSYGTAIKNEPNM